MIKKQDDVTDGLMRLRNLAVRDKVDKFLDRPAVYMQPHRNQLAKIEFAKKKFKPKVMVGDLRKPTNEFTSDLTQIAHNTRLIKRRMQEDGTKKSVSLSQKRHKDRVRRKAQAVVREQEDDLSLENYSWLSDESEVMEDVKKRAQNIRLRK